MYTGHSIYSRVLDMQLCDITLKILQQIQPVSFNFLVTSKQVERINMLLEVSSVLIFHSSNWSSARLQLMILKLYWITGSACISMTMARFSEVSSVFSILHILLNQFFLIFVLHNIMLYTSTFNYPPGFVTFMSVKRLDSNVIEGGCMKWCVRNVALSLLSRPKTIERSLVISLTVVISSTRSVPFLA